MEKLKSLNMKILCSSAKKDCTRWSITLNYNLMYMLTGTNGWLYMIFLEMSRRHLSIWNTLRISFIFSNTYLFRYKNRVL